MLALTPNHREELAAMALELQSNRAVFDGLTNWYGVFDFTGGCVPTADWNLVAITSYLEHPSGSDAVLTSGIEEYRDLAHTIGSLGQLGAGPRTLRCRHDMVDRFNRAAAKIRLVTNSLASSIAENGEPVAQSAATGAAIAAAYESGLKSSSWQQLRSMAIGALIGIAQDVAARAVPHVMNYLGNNRASSIDSSSIDQSTEPVETAFAPTN